MTKPKIYLFCESITDGGFAGDVMGHGIAEDGECLSGHLSSNVSFAKHDLGLTSNWKHDEYCKHYPDGFELEWIDEKDLDTHVGFQNAVKLNREMAKAEKPAILKQE